MSDQPVLVYAPMFSPAIGSFTGRAIKEDTSPHIAGCLSDHKLDMSDSAQFAAMKETLAAAGLKLELVVQPVWDSENKVGCLISAGVFVSDFQAALALPGFVRVSIYSGGQELLP